MKKRLDLMIALSGAMLLTSCGDGDRTVGNWIMAIVLILAALKRG